MLLVESFFFLNLPLYPLISFHLFLPLPLFFLSSLFNTLPLFPILAHSCSLYSSSPFPDLLFIHSVFPSVPPSPFVSFSCTLFYFLLCTYLFSISHSLCYK